MIRDCIKQSATATGAYTFALDAGAADLGLLTFRQGFLIPTVALLAGTIVHEHVPVRVDVTSGAAAGKWALMYATLTRDGANNLTLASDAARVVATSEYNGTTCAFTDLAITNGDAVKIGVVPITQQLLIADPLNATDGMQLSKLSGGAAFAAAGGNAYAADAIAIGSGAVGGGGGGVALGKNATASQDGALAIGEGAVAGKHCVAMGNGVTASYAAHETAFGAGNFWLGATGIYQMYLQPGYIHRQVVTSNATPTTLKSHDIHGAAGGTAEAAVLAGEDGIYCDAGITYFDGEVTCLNPATGDLKGWRLQFAIQTDPTYTVDGALLGSVTKTLVGGAGSLSAADINVVVNGPAQTSFTLEGTGIAATTLIWFWTSRISRHMVYV